MIKITILINEEDAPKLARFLVEFCEKREVKVAVDGDTDEVLDLVDFLMYKDVNVIQQ
jgi:hypothetical protein